MRPTTKARILLSAVAALSTSPHLTPVAHAFTHRSTWHSVRPPLSLPSSTRTFASKRGGIIDTVKNAGKSILPSSWFQSEEEKKAAIERQRVKSEIKGGMSELLKGAPLPVRMLGSLVAPMMSSLATGLAETMADQQKAVGGILEEATEYLSSDVGVVGMLGDPIQVGAPFSQSSSTSSINGQTSTQIRLAFPVSGSFGSGIAQVSATESGIQSLKLESSGRVIQVGLSRETRPKAKFAGSSNKNEDIIEAEIIEKTKSS